MQHINTIEDELINTIGDLLNNPVVKLKEIKPSDPVKKMKDIKNVISENISNDISQKIDCERVIYFIEPEYFDESRFMPFLKKMTDGSHKIVPMYIYPDGSKKVLNIKTAFSQFNYLYSRLSIDLGDNFNKNLQEVLHKIDKKIYGLIKNSDIKLDSYKFYTSVIGDQLSINYGNIKLDCKLSEQYNNTHVIKYNSKTFIKTMENSGKKIPQYETIAGFASKEFDEFINKQFGRKYNRFANYTARYIIYPKLYVFKNTLYSKIGIYNAEIKHGKSYVKSVIDKNEEVVGNDIVSTIYI